MKLRLVLAALGAVLLLVLAISTGDRARQVSAPAQVVPALSFSLQHAGDGVVRWILADGAVPGGPVTREEGVVEGERGDPLRIKTQVAQGAQVRVGDLLATIGSARSAEREAAEEAERQAREADLALVSLGGREEEIRWARREVEVVRAAVEQARSQSQRLAALVAEGAASAWEAQDAAMELRLREAELALATVGVDRAALAPREQELTLAQAEVASASARLAEARASRAHEQLLSPLDGRVDQPGGVILLRVNSDQPAVLQIALDAQHQGRVRVGDPVRFEAGVGGTRHQGRVLSVGDEVRAIGDRSVVWATASVDPPVAVGVTGTARVEVGS